MTDLPAPGPLPALPAELADALGDALYRAPGPLERQGKVAALAAKWPEHADSIRAHAAQWSAVMASEAADLPESFGPYQIEARLGRGGFGEVYLAEQEQPVRRKVALKVLKRGMDSDAILRRFAREQQALARMDHEAIARFYDAGTTPSGQPFFAMEHIDGESCVAYCRSHRLGRQERLQLFIQICRGVQHAHQRGIVHRDLKPSNVLVASRLGQHAPKLIDFGIARALEADDDGLTLTQGGEVMGTPAYMAPEQASTDFGAVDARTDVYALGALLCEMLTGESPLGAAVASARTPSEARERICGQEPMRPSQLKLAPDAEERAFQRSLRGDVDWIVQKAMAKERERRYQSAIELAADVERHLAVLPIAAGPPTLRYRARKFLRKYQGATAAALTVLLTAVVGALVALDYAQLANQRADDNAQLAADMKGLAESEARAKQEAVQQANALAKKVREFDLLSGVVLEGRARAAAAGLTPAWPTRMPAMRAWLHGDVAALRQLRPEVEAAIASLRAQALPWSAEDQERDWRGHPRHDEWRALQQRAAWLRRELQLAQGARDLGPLPAIDGGLDLGTLNQRAWARTAPNVQRTVWGEEALGLAYAEAAVAQGGSSPQLADLLDTLAWACIANGKDEAAQQAADRMAAAAAKDRRAAFAARAKEIAATIADRPTNLELADRAAAELESEIRGRRTWKFDEAAEGKAAEFLHLSLVDLLRRTDELMAGPVVEVERRLVWAEALEKGLDHQNPKARHSWDDVRRDLAANERYSAAPPKFTAEDVRDLAPIGKNPVTGLWEFCHLPSSCDDGQDPWSIEIPTHQSDGSLSPAAGLGIVFVLIPGGMALCGAQGEDPDLPLFDPDHDKPSSVVSVELAPFFLARHELTQTQWRRLWRGDPQLRAPSGWAQGENYGSPRLPPGSKVPPLTGDNPVENVDWDSAIAMLESYGLRLPTAVQWEYGGRAGSRDPWWAGPDFDDLQGKANLLDQFGSKAVPQWGRPEPWDDGHIVHAPVGSFPANAFGLHDVHGNVFEWCLDVSDSDGQRRPGDGLIVTIKDTPRILRGGSYSNGAIAARFAFLATNNPGFRDSKVGLRASRQLRASQPMAFR